MTEFAEHKREKKIKQIYVGLLYFKAIKSTKQKLK